MLFRAWWEEVEAQQARDGFVPLAAVARRLRVPTEDLGHWLFQKGIHVLRIEMTGGTLADARVRLVEEATDDLRDTVLAAYQDLDPAALQDVLARAMFMAEMGGRAHAR